MPGPIFVLDACVLYPVAVRDLLLTLAALDAFTPKWSNQILDEMRRNVLADHPEIDPARFNERMIGSMTVAFPDALVTGFDELIDEMDNDPADRHVAAVAVAVGAEAIVTDNVRHFRGNVLAKRGIAVMRPSDYVASVLADEASLVANAIRSMARRKLNPPMTADDVIDALAKCTGFKTVTATIRDAI